MLYPGCHGPAYLPLHRKEDGAAEEHGRLADPLQNTSHGTETTTLVFIESKELTTSRFLNSGILCEVYVCGEGGRGVAVFLSVCIFQMLL